MEHVSLKTSHSNGYTLNLRSTDQVLHDTTQRFVESLSNDVRISQFADINLVQKMLVNEKWYWLQPVLGARAGYLVCLPNQPIIWMDEQFKRSFRIPMRVSLPIFEKKSIFLASLNKVDGVLRLEDAWMVAGEFLRGRPFSQRWKELCSFYNTQFRPDQVLQQGFRIEIATYEPLSAVNTWQTIPPIAFAQGERGQRRLRVQLQEETRPKMNVKPPFTVKMERPAFIEDKIIEDRIIEDKIIEDKTIIHKKIEEEKENTAKAVPHEEYPDTYDLFVKGVKKGYAAVQDIVLSRKLRQATGKEKKEVLVKIEWNSEFDMFEIVSLL
jgi:hypothetical protein